MGIGFTNAAGKYKLFSIKYLQPIFGAKILRCWNPYRLCEAFPLSCVPPCTLQTFLKAASAVGIEIQRVGDAVPHAKRVCDEGA